MDHRHGRTPSEAIDVGEREAGDKVYQRATVPCKTFLLLQLAEKDFVHQEPGNKGRVFTQVFM